MKLGIKSVLCCSLFLMAEVSATDIWTADIANIYSYADGRAKVFLTNLSQGPSGQSSSACTSNGVWLAPNTTDSATPSALSLALTMFATQTSIRIAFNGQGGDCVLVNLGNR